MPGPYWTLNVRSNCTSQSQRALEQSNPFCVHCALVSALGAWRHASLYESVAPLLGHRIPRYSLAPAAWVGGITYRYSRIKVLSYLILSFFAMNKNLLPRVRPRSDS